MSEILVEESEPHKQHKGLRCKKCFALLVRDSDFDFRNGQLVVNPEIAPDWEGLKFRGKTVYCKNIHVVGFREEQSFAKKTSVITIIKPQKTTFDENFVKK